MSITPRILRKASKRLFYGPFLGESICFQCHLLAAYQRPNLLRRRAVLPHPSTPRIIQKRTFLDFLKQEEKDVPIQAHRQNLGIPVLATLVRFLDENIGFEPTTSELVKAFSLIVNDQSQRSLLRDPGNCYGVIRLLETLSKRDELSLIKDSDILTTLHGLESAYHEFAVHLAGMLLEFVRKTREKDVVLLRAAFEAVVATLANKGDYLKAMGFLKVGSETYGPEVITPAPWDYLLQKIIDMDNEEGLSQLAESPTARDPDKLGEVGILHGTVRFYLEREDMTSARSWWDELKASAKLDTYKIIFDYYVRHLDDAGMKDWADEVFQSLNSLQVPMDVTPPQAVIEENWLSPTEEKEVLKLKWMLNNGQNVERVAPLVHQVSPTPKIEMVNELVDFAIWKKDAATAQVLLMIADRWQLQPNRRSQILQIRLRMLCNDPTAAVSAWDNLKYFEDAADAGTETQELLAVMASNSETDPDVIQHIYSDVLKRNIFLDVDTLCALVNYHLQRSPLQTTVSVITREINTYIVQDRRKVIKVLRDYMGLPQTDVEKAWKIYEVIREIFLEMPVSVRKDFMELFFSRERSDLGCAVFIHMRHSGARPDAEAYTIAFRNIARLQDPMGLAEIHNLMKIDPNVEPDTDVYNSLIWAYNSCNMASKALDVFKQITMTNEGPDSDTLSLVMISCGLLHGAMKRRGEKIWLNFRKLGIVPTIHNYAMRISAWCMNGEYDEGFKVAKEMEQKDGVRPDRNVIMALYAEFLPSRRPEIEEWAHENYPKEWASITNDPSQPLKQFEGEVDKLIKNAPFVLL